MPRGFPGKFGIIPVIAGKEIREVSRDNLFRAWSISIFAVISIVNIFLTVLNWRVVFHAAFKYYKYIRYISYSRTEPSSVPATVTVFSTVAFSLAAFFISFQSMRRDYALDSSVAFETKEYPNLAWLAGKAAGILAAFMLVTYASLIPALLFNIYDADFSVGLIDYLTYPLIVSLPAYCFIIGAAFLLATLVGNQILAAALLILCVAPGALLAAKPFCWIFDPFAIRLPIVKSECAGFPDVGRILFSRSIPFFAGVSALAAASLCYKRLIQSRFWKFFALTIAVSGALAAAGIMTSESVNISNNRDMRKNMLAMNERGAKLPSPAMKACDIRLNHSGHGIRCEARIVLANENDVPLESYLFTLNPGLAVDKIVKNKLGVPFDREYHHLIVRPERPLVPGALDTVTVYYNGTIDEDACCLYASEERRLESAFNVGRDLVGIEKRRAVVKDDVIVLPGDVHWYPVPGVQYVRSNPFFQRADFCQYSLDVKTRDGLTAVSQGRMSLADEGGFLFVPETPLAGISLFAGRYSRRSIEVDSTNYEIYSYADHDIIAKHYLSIADTIGTLIKEIRSRVESEYGLSYPFGKFAIVEVPAFYSESGNVRWVGGERAYQPEMILVPERCFSQFGMYKMFEPGEFNGTIDMKHYISHMVGFSIVELGRPDPLYSFSNYFSSPGMEYFGKAIESYIDSRVYWEPAVFGPKEPNRLKGWDYLSLWLHGCVVPEQADFGSETELSAELSVARGVCLFNYLEARFADRKFAAVLNEYIEENRFKRISLDNLIEAMSARLGTDIRPIIDRWMDTEKLPGFIVGDAVCSNDGKSAFFKVSFEAFNGGEAPGVFCVRIGAGDKYDIYPVYLEAGESKTIEIPFKKCPSILHLHTMLSQNLPSRFSVKVHRRDNSNVRAPRPDTSVGEGPGIDAAIVIVDNEDPGFVATEPESAALWKLFSSRDGEEGRYAPFTRYRIPLKWTPVYDRIFYGDYMKTAHICRAGKGERMAAWNANLEQEGFYEIFVYIDDCTSATMSEEQARIKYDRHQAYRVAHRNGTDVVKLNLYQAEAGWNLLGRYYFSAGDASVELTNESESGYVIADAVMWRKVDQRSK